MATTFAAITAKSTAVYKSSILVPRKGAEVLPSAEAQAPGARVQRPLVSIRSSNGDHGHEDMSAKHRTHDPKKGGETDHNCPPFGEPPSPPDLAKLRLPPLVPAIATGRIFIRSLHRVLHALHHFLRCFRCRSYVKRL